MLAENVTGTDESYFEVTVFERHSEVAGIWNSTSPESDNFQTPMYQGLETNVPRTLMTFKDFPYPDDVSLFPTHDKIKQYLEDYAADISGCIMLNSEVAKVTKVKKSSQPKWKVDVANTVKGVKMTSVYFDVVIVATGTSNEYNFPPDLDWESWEKANPGTILHSRDFRGAEDFKDKESCSQIPEMLLTRIQKVLIVGGGPSYFDIAQRISSYVKGDIIVSTKAPLPMLSTKNQLNLSKPTNLLPMERGVKFEADEAQYDIDNIILCTGYRYGYSFIPKLKLSKKGMRLCDVWDQMFWIPDPTLAFVGLPKMSAIFTVVEAQSAYIARALAGRISIPTISNMHRELEHEMRNRQKLRASTKAAENGFHNFNYPQDKDYVNKLSQACWIADKENLGNKPPEFDAYMDWTRANLGAVRTAFGKKGKEKQFHHAGVSWLLLQDLRDIASTISNLMVLSLCSYHLSKLRNTA